jgi:exonuclease VII large subunit
LEKIIFINKQLSSSYSLYLKELNENLNIVMQFLNLNSLKNSIKTKEEKIRGLHKSTNQLIKNKMKYLDLNLNNTFSRFRNLDIKQVLKRGFAIITDENNKIIKTKNSAKKNKDILIEFSDGISKAKIF